MRRFFMLIFFVHHDFYNSCFIVARHLIYYPVYHLAYYIYCLDILSCVATFDDVPDKGGHMGPPLRRLSSVIFGDFDFVFRIY